MGRFVINGGRALGGEISVSGSKNAALPIIFSCITLHGRSTLYGVPDIEDVNVAFDILSELGAKIERTQSCVTVDSRNLVYKTPSPDSVAKIRASTYLIGACLARFGNAEICGFGGCNFDSRPIDMHVMAARTLGATLLSGCLSAKELVGADIRFDKISVGATVNAIIMCASAQGTSRIYGYAKEPHVISLIEFLKGAGAKIKISEDFIEIEGGYLESSSATVIPDMIEAGTYLALSLMTNSEIKVVGADRNHLESFLDFLLHSGVVIEFDDRALTVSGSICETSEIVTAPYPAFPTDLQPQMAPLLATAMGGTIKETVWQNRFGYLSELKKFGVEYELFDGYAKIKKSAIRAARAKAPDLRGGAALVIAALAAKGESVIDNSELLARGYGDMVRKLQKVGADIIEA